MNLVLTIILSVIGATYGLASIFAMFDYVMTDNGTDKQIEKAFITALLLLPVSVIIGPYFIYKVLKGGTKKA